MASAVGVSDLPTEALDEIARRVGPLDNVACSAVCRPWRRALRTTRLRLLGRRPSRPHNICICRWRPVVRISPYGLDTYDTWWRRSPAVETAVDGEVKGRRILGCSYGWAVAVDDDTWGMSLLDPLTGRSLPLPPFSDSLPGKQRREVLLLKGEFRFWMHMFRKAALAPGRRLGTYAVMLLHSNGRGLSYLRPGAASWAALRLPRGMPHKYLDVIFHRGAFYTVSCYAELNAWVPEDGGLRARRLTNPQREQVWAVLAASRDGDGILMVSRADTQVECDYSSYYQREERRYKVERCAEGDRRWLPVPVEKLEEMTILVGEGLSLCVPRSSGRGAGRRAGDYGYKTNGPVEECTSHWFLPYVARLNPAFR